jgi:NAD+ kinase
MPLRHVGVIADTQDKANKANDAREKLLQSNPSLVRIDEVRDVKGLKTIIAMGGDGFMLHTMHNFLSSNIPVYGMNCGTVGFMLNNFSLHNVEQRLEEAVATSVRPLKMVAQTADGMRYETLAFNEVSLLRSSGQAAKIRVTLDDKVMIEEMVCDGVLVATPAGSSAYNFSAGGTILPLKANLLSLTPISAFRPRRWRGAVLPDNINIKLEILKSHKRPVDAVADFKEVRNVTSVEVFLEKEREITLLFDAGHGLEERILREQFAV